MAIRIFFFLLSAVTMNHSASAADQYTYISTIKKECIIAKNSDQFTSQVLAVLGDTANQTVDPKVRDQYLKSLKLFINVNVPYIEKDPRRVAYALAFYIDDAIWRTKKKKHSDWDYTNLVNTFSKHVENKLLDGTDENSGKAIRAEVQRKIARLRKHMLWRINIYQQDYLCPAYREHNDDDLMKEVDDVINQYKFMKYQKGGDDKEYTRYTDRSIMLLEEFALMHIFYRQIYQKLKSDAFWCVMDPEVTSYDTKRIPQEMRVYQWPGLLLLEPRKQAEAGISH